MSSPTYRWNPVFLSLTVVMDWHSHYVLSREVSVRFLKEQGNHYAAYIASIHLAATRFCLLMIGKHQRGAARGADIRNAISLNVTAIDFAAELWQVFRALLITGTLDGLKSVLGDLVTTILETIVRQVQCSSCKPFKLIPEPCAWKSHDSRPSGQIPAENEF